MDITDISSLYNSYVTDTATSTKNSIDTAKDYSKASDEELMDACKKFEAYFLEQCFKEMLKTVGNDDSVSGANSTLLDYYKENLVQEISEQSTEKESLGLAQMLYEQMKRNYDI